MSRGGAPPAVLGGFSLAGPVLAAGETGLAKLAVYGVIFVGYLVLAAVKAARKRAAARRAETLPPEPARRADPIGRPPEVPRAPRSARVPPAKPAPAPRAEAGARKTYMEQAPEMSTTGAAHAAHHEHLADLAATAIRTDAHLGHLVSEKHPGQMTSEKHPGAHPSSVAARSRRLAGRALLLAREPSPADRVRAAVLWNAVLLRRPPLGTRRRA